MKHSKEESCHYLVTDVLDEQNHDCDGNLWEDEAYQIGAQVWGEPAYTKPDNQVSPLQSSLSHPSGEKAS